MAKKRPDPSKSRLKRFGKWSDSHRADILEEVGLSEHDFRALSRGDRKNTLNRGLSLDKQSKDPAYTTAPQSVEQLRAAAGNAGQLRYGQAQSTLGQYGQSIDPWFQDYVTRTQQIQGQQQAMAAPVIAQAQTNADQAGKTVLNADPNSEAGQNDALAAASRKALGDAFATMLSGQQTATNTNYTNQAGAVEAARIGEHGNQNRSMQDLLKERGAFESDYLTTAKDREHTKALERKAFDLKTYEAGAAADEKANEVNQYGVKNSTWANWGRNKRKAWIADFNKDTAKPTSPGEPKYGVNADKWATMTPAQRKAAKDAWEDGGGEGGTKAYTPAQHHEATVDLRKGVALVQGRLGGKKTAPDSYWNQAYQALITEKGMDPALARAAIQLVRLGGVGGKTKAALERDYGITKFPKGSKRKKPPAYHPSGRPGTAPSGTGDGKGNDSRRPT